MIVGIYALNIRDGGGVTHLIEILSELDTSSHDFKRIVLWSSAQTLSKIEDKEWLCKIEIKQTKINLLNRFIFFFINLKKLASNERCDLLLFPGGSVHSSFRPVITMHRNLLPFETKEILRYGLSLETLKQFLLRIIQKKSLKNSDGVIFLTDYAKSKILQKIGPIKAETKVIGHGVDESFFAPPRTQLNINEYNFQKPFKILNVSIFQPYKHQWNLASAVSRLRQKGMPVECHFIGGGHKKSIKRLQNKISFEDPSNEFLFYHGKVEYKDISNYYKNADIFAYTSSVETFGQTLLEGMASGLPVACSDMSCMSEILKDTGVYFDPLNIDSIEKSISLLVNDKKLRENLSERSYDRSKDFLWKYTAEETFKLIRSVVLRSKTKNHV